MSDVDDIRRQMAQIRRDMHLDVSQVVGGVEEAMDWRSIIRNHPYLTIGVGLAAGYLIVPKRRRVERAPVEVRPVLDTDAAPNYEVQAPARHRQSLARKAAGWTVGLLWPLVSQSVQAYAAMWLETQLKQHMKLHPQASHPEAPPPSARDDPFGGDAVYRMPKRG